MAVKLIECPRDAMQGLKEFIPTEMKVEYIQKLLDVNFHILDCVSFVSPKAIPQLRDSSAVLDRLDMSSTKTKLLSIVANERGAKEAIAHDKISYLGFPFSVSEEFQRRNTNSTIQQSYDRVMRIQELCVKGNKKAVVYISMGFGNPYGEEWNEEIVEHWVEKIYSLGIDMISLSDTIGVARSESISRLFRHLIPKYPKVDIGAHFHTRPNEWKEKVDAAYNAGCMRYDGAIKGYGGCPMADDELTGNMPMENLIHYFDGKEEMNIRQEAFMEAMKASIRVFS